MGNSDIERGNQFRSLKSLATGKLYGKDGVAGGQQLLIIALLDVTFKLDGECVHDVPVFVQPGSSQACLLGN